jgi:hypothetical protein
MTDFRLKEKYQAFIDGENGNLSNLNYEYMRVDNILADINTTVDADLLEELEIELSEVLDMLERAILFAEEAKQIAEANYKYELKFKQNR